MYVYGKSRRNHIAKEICFDVPAYECGGNRIEENYQVMWLARYIQRQIYGPQQHFASEPSKLKKSDVNELARQMIS